jgi:hypothetical protein
MSSLLWVVEGSLDFGPTINDLHTSLGRCTTTVEAQSARRGFLQTVLGYVRSLIASAAFGALASAQSLLRYQGSLCPLEPFMCCLGATAVVRS